MSRAALVLIRCAGGEQERRLRRFSAEHPEVDFGAADGTPVAYAPAGRSGYTAAAEDVDALLDKLEEFYAGIANADGG